jgi:hypothetical protein
MQKIDEIDSRVWNSKTRETLITNPRRNKDYEKKAVLALPPFHNIVIKF